MVFSARAFGCNMTSSYEGTLFRFPLRNQHQSTVSRISKQVRWNAGGPVASSSVPSTQGHGETQVYGPARILELFDALREESSRMLLFLKSVEVLEAMVWEQGDKEPRLLHACEVYSPGADLRAQRRLFLDVAANGERRGVPVAGLHQLDLVHRCVAERSRAECLRDLSRHERFHMAVAACSNHCQEAAASSISRPGLASGS